MRRLERWLFSPGAPERVAVLRIGLCSVLALRLSRSAYVALAGQPRALYQPRSFMHLFGQMPSRPTVIVVQAIGVTAAVLAALGWRARFTLPVAWVAGVFLNGMATSVGKIVHNDVVLLLCLFPLIAAPTSDAWSLDARAGRARARPKWAYGWPINTALVVVAGAYFFAGFAKLVNSGVAWVTSGNLRWVLYIASDSRAHPNPAALFVADRPWLAHLIAASSLLLELTFLVILFSKRARPFYVVGAIGFHIGIWLTIGLDYWAQAATVAIVLIDWPAVLSRWHVPRERHEYGTLVVEQSPARVTAPGTR
jgi:hypothetical protein